MICPLCGHDHAIVTETRQRDGGKETLRRYLCRGCGGRFPTREQAYYFDGTWKLYGTSADSGLNLVQEEADVA